MLFDEDDYVKILKEKYKDDLMVISVDSSQISGVIEGFLGEYHNLKITYKSNDEVKQDVFFVKSKPIRNESQTLWTKELRTYEKEIFLYDNIFKKFEKLGYDTDFSPKCYLTKENRVIVMDDLKSMGYQMLGRNNFFDIDHCKASIESLATYHANALSYESFRSRKLGRDFSIVEENPEVFIEVLYPPPGTAPNETSGNYVFYTKQALLKLCDHLEESQRFKSELKSKISKFDYSQVLWQDLPIPKTLYHGDLWSNNMLFKYKNNSKTPSHCRLVDFQMFRYSYPCFDPLLLLYSNTRWTFRKNHLEFLLKYYYDRLHEVLKRNRSDLVVSWSDFWISVKALESAALMQAIAGRTITMLPVEITSAAVQSGEVDLNGIIFEKRPDFVVKAFENDRNFRDIITEDLYNINEVL